MRDRVAELSGTLGDPARDRPEPGGGGDRGGPGPPRPAWSRCGRCWRRSVPRPRWSGSSPDDPAGAGGLWAGELTRRFAGSELVRSVRAIAESVLAGWPELLPRPADR